MVCVINILVWISYFELVRWWNPRETTTASPMDKLYEKFIKYFNRAFHLTIILPIAFAMCAGPLFAPFAGLPLAQQVRRNAFTRIPLSTIHTYSTNGRTSVTPSREKPTPITFTQFFSTASHVILLPRNPRLNRQNPLLRLRHDKRPKRNNPNALIRRRSVTRGRSGRPSTKHPIRINRLHRKKQFHLSAMRNGGQLDYGSCPMYDRDLSNFAVS